ncbi:collagen-like triple helix repeat-containing protein, partial [Burkholderia cenocepacia]|nr:collagen-like triple helix repeat-containing protein [Burkholderia cenocepacia]HDR9884896.1 collagen-like triple helix repeat-containing protein [Burkholderia cenocepacia]
MHNHFIKANVSLAAIATACALAACGGGDITAPTLAGNTIGTSTSGTNGTGGTSGTSGTSGT